MTRCVQCGHAYFSAWSGGHRSGLCVACRLKKGGGLGPKLGPKRRTAPAPPPAALGEGWITLHEAARLLARKVDTLQTSRWLARLGAMKIGREWLVARAALDALKEQRD